MTGAVHDNRAYHITLTGEVDWRLLCDQYRLDYVNRVGNASTKSCSLLDAAVTVPVFVVLDTLSVPEVLGAVAIAGEPGIFLAFLNAGS